MTDENVKKMFFPGLALVLSSFVSYIFAAGLIIGYIATNLFCDKFVKTGKVDLLILEFGNWKVHLHHWILGIMIFGAAYFMGILSDMPMLIVGTVGGLIIHDFHTDKSWYKVVYKE